jgi:4-hydroxythreonine-4-phosphate dehydrogenase
VYQPRIVITSGEPAGIGPDACVMLAQEDFAAELVVAADVGLLRATAAALGVPLEVQPYAPSSPRGTHRAGSLRVLPVPVAQAVIPGRLDKRNATYVTAMLDRACDGCMNGEFAAMVTAPVQKSILIDAGIPFIGHTEYLAARTRAALPVMMLLAGSVRVALVTTHLALADVPAAITRERLAATLRIVHADLGRYFRLDAPRIAVLGLNPHAGEGGHLGREEQDVIEPVIAAGQRAGMDLRGPVPADTAFTTQFLAGVDVIVAMYHDQGLPVIKHLGFGHGVNLTLGLPILRTSVDHGTALSLARTGRADIGSLRAALALAIDLAGPNAGMQPRKRFGQHFLHDPAAIRRIVDAIAPADGERLVEIGPGRGALTWPLLERAKRLEAIEIDRDLARQLRADPRGRDGLEVHERNVLDLDFHALRGAGAKLRIVGNLPYNISTPLLFHLLAQRDAIADMHFMLQREVVERMAAMHGTRAYGRLTIMVAAFAEVEHLFDLGPGAFSPPPKVWSAIVRLRAGDGPRFPDRQRAPPAHGRSGSLLAPAQDPAQRSEGTAGRRGSARLRHRPRAAPADDPAARLGPAGGTAGRQDALALGYTRTACTAIGKSLYCWIFQTQVCRLRWLPATWPRSAAPGLLPCTSSNSFRSSPWARH